MKERPGLVWLEQKWGYEKRPEEDSCWIFVGTEGFVCHPMKGLDSLGMGAWTNQRGIREYGRAKVKGHEGQIIYKVANQFTHILIGLGWTCIKRAIYYDYVTREFEPSEDKEER